MNLKSIKNTFNMNIMEKLIIIVLYIVIPMKLILKAMVIMEPLVILK